MKLRGLRVLVTGGAGFIGSHIVDSLVSEGASVIVFDNFQFGSEDNLIQSKSSVKIIHGDIMDVKALTDASKNIDVISHQAAQLEILKASKDPGIDLDINTIGTLNVLAAAQVNNIKKILFASSACVYGQAKTDIQDETHPTDPNWAYGVSKLAAEKYCQIFATDIGIPVTMFRYGIVYGEREWYRRVLTLFIKRVLQNEPPVIFGSGDQYRDFTNVHDLVRLHNMCIENKMSDNEIFNIGTAKNTTLKELADIVIKVSGKSLRTIYEEVAEGSESKYVIGKRRNTAELKGMCLGYKKAERLLGWSPQISLEEGILREMQWAKEHLSRWDHITYTD